MNKKDNIFNIIDNIDKCKKDECSVKQEVYDYMEKLIDEINSPRDDIMVNQVKNLVKDLPYWKRQEVKLIISNLVRIRAERLEEFIRTL